MFHKRNHTRRTGSFVLNNLTPNTVMIEDFTPNSRSDAHRGLVLKGSKYYGGKAVIFLKRDSIVMFNHNHVAVTLVPKNYIYAVIKYTDHSHYSHILKNFYLLTTDIRKKVLHGVDIQSEELEDTVNKSLK